MSIRNILISCIGLIFAGCQSQIAVLSGPTTALASDPTLPAPLMTVVPNTVLSETKTLGVETLLVTPTITVTVALPFITNMYAIGLEPLVSGLALPTSLTAAGDGSGRLFVTEQVGRIRIIANNQLLAQPFLDLTGVVSSNANERGLLSMAFSPNFTTDHHFFVYYTRKSDNAVTIARYNVSANDPNQADPASASIILTINHPETNHNGGQLQFGPDGYLYIGVGDGGGAGDQHGAIGNGQNLGVDLGKLLRLDVSSAQPYAIPASNPFISRQGAQPEIWAYGLRNPWRFSFDRLTHNLYIADVGQDTYEEVDVQPANSIGGENYGWRLMEGLHCYNPSVGCDQTGITLPKVEYSHVAGNCSITGGYVYRGAQFPAMNGAYFYADYCSGMIWSLQQLTSGQWQMTERLSSALRITSFGEDQVGELYVVDQNGTIFHLVAK